jgi:hypothetical protein
MSEPAYIIVYESKLTETSQSKPALEPKSQAFEK